MNRACIVVQVLVLLSLLALFSPLVAQAEPCVLAYPIENVIFKFDPVAHEMVFPGDSRYDFQYDRSGVMLWDKSSGRVAYEAYQAPRLQGFQPNNMGTSTFYLLGNRYTLVIDGYYHAPRKLNNIYVRFTPTPADASPIIHINGEQFYGLYYHIPQLDVSTLTDEGYYSDSINLNMSWTGAEAIEITVFSDRNNNGVFDGEPCSTVFMEDMTIPTENLSWGAIKSLYE